MANITIAGNSYVIASDVAMQDLEAVKKYRPTALTLIDEETKEPYFKVGIGGNSLNDHGISFGGVSNDEDKVATATLTIPADVEDKKEYVCDKAGIAVMNLNKIESGIAKALDEINTERAALADSIIVSV
ncbi:MAG: hypothetical protein FWG83_02790 [Oscillospiraceae bacterium]|nr:hypothetical protein [Oscillospiraceae bacterium]